MLKILTLIVLNYILICNCAILEPKLVVAPRLLPPGLEYLRKTHNLWLKSLSDKIKTGTDNEGKYWEWAGVDIQFPNVQIKRAAEKSGKYCKSCMIATRFQYNPTLKEIYMIFPRYKNGVAITLAKTEASKELSAPAFIPYPNWQYQEEGNCEAIQSAVDIYLDSEGLLWVLDSGVTESLLNPTRKCSPKILVISTLNGGKVIKSIDLRHLTTANSRVQYIIVDEEKPGRKYLYISDSAMNTIIVWDVFGDIGWKVILPSQVRDSNLLSDTMYIALVKNLDHTELFFTYLLSSNIFSTKTKFLRTSEGKIIDHGKKPNRMILFGTSDGNKLYFRFEKDDNIYEWNTKKCLLDKNFKLLKVGDAFCENCRLTTHVSNGPDKCKYGLESNYIDYIKDNTGCVGTSMAFYPIKNTKELTPVQKLLKNILPK